MVALGKGIDRVSVTYPQHFFHDGPVSQRRQLWLSCHAFLTLAFYW